MMARALALMLSSILLLPESVWAGAAPAPAAVSSGAGNAADAGPAPQAKADAVPALVAKTRYFEGMGRTETEKARLEELTRAIETYEAESKEFRHEIQLLVEKKYEEKRNTLSNSYEAAIRDLEILERRERLDAIAAFEEFLQRYPNDPRYTPDVLFRLAELHFERSSDDYNLAMREYEETLKKSEAEAGATSAPPAEPKKDFAKSIALYGRLIGEFATYRLNDASLYLLGYCHEQQGDPEKARENYLALIDRYPKSKFTTEAWMRIGEYYFEAYDQPDALAKAADAYEHTVSDTKHPLFDKALYKLGWTYYRMDRFDDAVARFLALVDHYQAVAKSKGDEEVGGDLRTEALQYTAVSLVDEKWGSLARAREVFAALGGRPYEAEVYRRMGDIYYDQTKHPEAIEAYRLVLQKDPLNKDAPQIQQRIVQAYERDRKLDESFAESSKLSSMFLPGTPWNEKWKRDPDVILGANELAEKSLYTSATYHHQQALVYKQDGKFELAKAAFEIAAKAYGTYLHRFPRSKNAYDMEYYWADCLYNSFQFEEAAKHYAAVRDSAQDTKYLQDAAYSTVLALQKQLDLDIKAGTVAARKPLKSTERPEGEKLTPIELHESEKRLVAASDRYLSMLQATDEKAPGIAYRAAELFYTHNQLDEARKRFETIVGTYPKSEVAKYAVNLIVESYLTDKNWAKVEEVSARMAANKEVIDPKSDLYKELTKFKLGGRFKLAEELMGKGEFDAAAKKYIGLVDEEPKHEFADKALNNAAVCYENVQRFDSALRLYERIFSEYPASKLAAGALFRVAVNAEKSYDFDKAIDNYQKLVKEYPQSKDRESALFNTARLLEGLQRYNEAAAAYLRYADTYPTSEDAPKNQFRAALIYEKQSDFNKEVGALTEFVQKFSKNQSQVELVVDAKKRIGDAWMKLKREGEARNAYRAAAEEFDRRGLAPDKNPVAAEAAAFSRFQLAEAVFAEFDRVRIAGSGKALANSFAAKRELVKKVNEAFEQVVRYKRVEWTLAAFYRKGYTLERFAQTMLETPVPPEVKRLGEDAVVAYQDGLATQTVSLEDRAVENYVGTITKARELHVSNEWTKKTLESLNRFRPKDYPVLKEPKSIISSDFSFPDGAVATVEGNVRLQAAPQKLKEDDK
jgi:TolA-binding protein